LATISFEESDPEGSGPKLPSTVAIAYNISLEVEKANGAGTVNLSIAQIKTPPSNLRLSLFYTPACRIWGILP
jgi:hypothetical protein